MVSELLGKDRNGNKASEGSEDIGILHLKVISHAGNHLFLLTIVSLVPLCLEWSILTHCRKISPVPTFAVVDHESDGG